MSPKDIFPKHSYDICVGGVCVCVPIKTKITAANTSLKTKNCANKIIIVCTSLTYNNNRHELNIYLKHKKNAFHIGLSAFSWYFIDFYPYTHTLYGCMKECVSFRFI